jgi:hypothetical protein
MTTGENTMTDDDGHEELTSYLNREIDAFVKTRPQTRPSHVREALAKVITKLERSMIPDKPDTPDHMLEIVARWQGLTLEELKKRIEHYKHAHRN